MCKRIKRIILALVLAVVIMGVLSQTSEAARWRYHAWRRGHVTVWPTRNCRRVTTPLVYRRYMWRCQTIGGYLPWWCNDWLVRHEWGWPCYNVTWRKYVARPCPRSCWRKRWILGPLYDYFEDYVPYEYGVGQVIVPTIGDPNGHITGNQELYVFVDLGEWLDAGQPYTTPPPETDPNLVYYDFTDGCSPELPGFTVMHVEPDTEVEELIVFNPDADPNGYPFEVTRPNLLFTGRLYLEGEQTFDNQEYNGYLMAGDNNFDGTVNLHDLARLADVYLETAETTCTDMDGDGYGQTASAACTYPEIDCDDTDPTINPGADEVCDGKDNDCNPATPDGMDEPWYGAACDGDDSDLCQEGVWVCVDGMQTCTDNTGDNLELCDGIDNDCNPATPDGMDEPWYGAACDGDDTDLCAEGVYVCEGGVQICTDTTADSLEVCDGIDNDCNPATPDGMDEPWYGAACDGNDTDLCAEGVYVCIDGIQTCTDNTGDNLELCDGIDNDCNPATPDGADEPWYGAACDGNDTDLCEEGVYVCADGIQMCTDDTGDDLEICDNGIDDDCDGLTDWEDPNCSYPSCWDCPTQCHGDVNCDFEVDSFDESIFEAAYGKCYGEAGYEPCADFNRDWCVDDTDGAILYTYYGYPPPDDCPPGP